MNQNFVLPDIWRTDAVVAGAVSLAVCIFLILTKRWHGELSMDSAVGVQKFHTAPTPRIGGVAIVAGVIAGYALVSNDVAAAAKREILLAILLAGIPAFIFGLLEDLTKRVSVRARLLATIGSGVLGWGITGVSVTQVGIPGADWLLGFTVVSVVFTGIAVGGVANAINIIDGFNGLAAGAVLIMLAAFGIIAQDVGDIPLAFSCLVIAGAVAGFWLVNWPYGKIFLGDGGAYFVGFALAWIAVLLPHRNPSVSYWTSLLVCAYPVLEVLFSAIRRARRAGHSPGSADCMHLHHMVHRRIALKLFSKAQPAMQNGLTSPFIWLAVLLPSAFALLTHSSALWTAIAFFLCAVIYQRVYFRISKFKWV